MLNFQSHFGRQVEQQGNKLVSQLDIRELGLHIVDER